MSGRISIRNWRVTGARPSGLHVWFDPSCEFVRLYRIRSPDGQLRVPGKGVDFREESCYLDRVGSVSADEAEADAVSDRFEQGSLPLGQDDLPF